MNAYDNDPRVTKVHDDLYAVARTSGEWTVCREPNGWTGYSPDGEPLVDAFANGGQYYRDTAEVVLKAILGWPQ